MPPITCRVFIEFLDDYIAGSQPQPVRDEFEQHIASCRQCDDYLRTYRDTVKLGKAAFQLSTNAPVPPEVPDELVQAVLAITARKPCPGHRSTPRQTDV